ncbi:MAG: hypothetical protein ACR2GW_04180, partial [Pyrinomonadaceae bacterium]
MTASNIAKCIIAKLRWMRMVAGCTPGVRMVSCRTRFHCKITFSPDEFASICGTHQDADDVAQTGQY